jgi:hypothetical protein
VVVKESKRLLRGTFMETKIGSEECERRQFVSARAQEYLFAAYSCMQSDDMAWFMGCHSLHGQEDMGVSK